MEGKTGEEASLLWEIFKDSQDREAIVICNEIFMKMFFKIRAGVSAQLVSKL